MRSRQAIISLPATGCPLPIPAMPGGREWTKPERARWRELWRSPQATQWDESAKATVALLVAYGDRHPGRLRNRLAGRGMPPCERKLGLNASKYGRFGLGDSRVSNRRKARRRDLPGKVAGHGGVPRSLLIGPLIETWTGPVALASQCDTQESVALGAAVAAVCGRRCAAGGSTPPASPTRPNGASSCPPKGALQRRGVPRS